MVSELARAAAGIVEHALGLGKGYNEKRVMGQVKAVFYVPRRDNDGRDLQAEIEDLLDELYARFLGWTFLGPIEGAYRMADGTRSLDESGSYSVVLDEARVPELERVLRNFKSKTLQEAIYLEIHRDIELRLI